MTAAALGPPAAAALSPLIARAAFPVSGGVEGHRLGKKVAKAVGLPEEVGGVPGAVLGAFNPGLALTAGIGEHWGGAEGGLAGVALSALAR